jgi:FAD/FMN-containing dehydrogenase
MTVTFSADVTLAQLNERLARHGQWLPVDGDPTLSLGSLVLRNSTGPLRLGFGGWRDLLLGAQFVDGAGNLVTVGGRVVKNVAGYDLTKFLVGSFGCFGLPVTLSTRTYRAPAGALVVELPPSRVKPNELLVSPLKPQYAMRTPGTAWLGYLGDGATLDYYRATLPSFGGTLHERTVEQDVRWRASLWRFATAAGAFRIAVPPARLDELLLTLPHDDWCADLAFGVVVGRSHDPDALGDAAGRFGGTCVCFDDAGLPLRGAVSGESSSLLLKLKRQFDPDGLLPALPAGAS